MLSIIVCVLGMCLIIFYIIKNGFQKRNSNEIPGPKGHFLVGNTFDFFMDFESMFYYFRSLVNEYKDVCKLKLILMDVLLLTHPGYIEKLISGSQNNDKGMFYMLLRPWLREGLLLSGGAKWHQRRKILTPAFHYKILRHFNEIIMNKSNELVQSLQPEVNKPKTDIYSFLTDFTIKSICETAMGTTLDKETSNISLRYKEAIHELGQYLNYRFIRAWLYLEPVFNLTEVGKQQKRLLNLISSFRNRVINIRRENDNSYKEMIIDTDDNKSLTMLDILLKAEQEGAIDVEGINEEVDTFMFEGHDTTATALLFIFLLLANHPEEQEKIVEEYLEKFGSHHRTPTFSELADMKYLEACIKESLRLYPPVFFMIRQSKHSVKIGNFECAPGTNYAVMIYDLHRRADQFVDPLKFNPERFLKEPTWHQFAYIPFSAGPRNCIGQKFAMMEMKLAVIAVLREFRLLSVTTMEDVKFVVDIILRPKNPIYVKFEKR